MSSAGKDTKYKRVRRQGGGLLTDFDDALLNPIGYDDDLTRSAIEEAEAQRHARRKEAAAKAAVTRKRRLEKRVAHVAEWILRGNALSARDYCAVCGKELNDPQSTSRGIGPECWQVILKAVDDAKRGDAP